MKPLPAGGQFALTVFALVLLGVFVIFAGKWLTGGGHDVPQFAGTSTETEFNKDVVEGVDKNSFAWTASYFRDEWPVARSVHKIIAYTIARCSQIDIDQMPRSSFSALLLDLRPDGGHMWANSSTSQQNPTKISLTPYQQTILSISDGIAQGRIAAAKGADNFYPNMIQFGWAAVIVSALATMFVTLKSSVANPQPAEKKTYAWYAMTTWFYVVGFLAIALSTTSTILAGAKQFWDPTAAYMRNEATLVALRQLHAEIALDSIAHMDENCNSKDTSQEAKVTRWVSTLVSLQPGTVTAPVLIASQLAGSSPVVMVSSTEPPGKEQQPKTGNSPPNASSNSQPPGAQPLAHAPPTR